MKGPNHRFWAGLLVVVFGGAYLAVSVHWPDLAQSLALLYIALIVTVAVFCNDRGQGR